MNIPSAPLSPPASSVNRPLPLAVWCTAAITLLLWIFVSPKHRSSCPASLF